MSERPATEQDTVEAAVTRAFAFPRVGAADLDAAQHGGHSPIRD